MKVLKFGGGLIDSPYAMIKIVKAIQALSRDSHRLVVVISAIGKTTNGLEKAAQFFLQGDVRGSEKNFDILKKYHL